MPRRRREERGGNSEYTREREEGEREASVRAKEGRELKISLISVEGGIRAVNFSHFQGLSLRLSFS